MRISGGHDFTGCGKSLWGKRVWHDVAQGKLIRSSDAWKRQAARSSVQLCECGAADCERSSVAADSGDDRCGVGGVIGGVRSIICGGRTSVDCTGETVAGAAVTGAVLAAERAAVDGRDELQPAVPMVCGIGNG